MNKFSIEVVSIEQAMPEPGETVLLRIQWGSGMYDWVSGYFGEEDLFYQNNTDATLDSVTHWVKLPDVDKIK